MVGSKGSKNSWFASGGIRVNASIIMKRIAGFITASVALILAGCLYEVPFVEKVDLQIDRGLVGAWVEKGEAGKAVDRMVVLPFSETEYLIHYPTEGNGFYFRGYPIDLGGKHYIQLQVLGTRDGLVKDLETPYTLASCSRDGETLTIRLINKTVIDPKFKDSPALREAFLAHQDDANLFEAPKEFVRADDGK